MIRVAKLVGFSDLVGQEMAFILPAFRVGDNDNSLWSQVLSFDGRIVGFREVSIQGRHFTYHKDGMLASIGEEGIWGFQWKTGDYALARESTLRELLIKRKTHRTTKRAPLLHLDVIDFCGLTRGRSNAVIAAYESLNEISPKCARLWRDDQIIAPAIRSALALVNVEARDAAKQELQVTDFKIEGRTLVLPLPDKLRSAVKKHAVARESLDELLQVFGLRLSFEDPREAIVKELSSLWKRAKDKKVDKNEIDDVINEVVVRALSEASGKPRHLTMREWLNLLLDSAIGRRRWTLESEQLFSNREAADMAIAPEGPWKVRYTEFQSLLTTLPRREQEALVLVGASGFSYKDAAAIIGTTERTVRNRVTKARRALLEKIDLSLPLSVSQGI